MAGMDLTSILLLGAGAYALTKIGGTAAPTNVGQTTQQAAGSTVLDELASQGVNVAPTDEVRQYTTVTPAGQTVTYATVNYSPWDPNMGQTVYLNPLDSNRLAGQYIPQFPQWLKDAFGGEDRAFDWLRNATTRIDASNPPTSRVWDFQMPVKDWDALRIRDSREQPITAAEAAAAGFTLDDPVTLNGYWEKVQLTGGWIRGSELHKGPRASFAGLGRMASGDIAPKYWYFQ